MKLKQTALLAALAAGATITTMEAGFLPGMTVAAILHSPAGAFVGSAQVQTSQDNVTWVNATGSTAVTAGGTDIQLITLAQYVRLNVTAYTSGGIKATFLSDIN